jgi:hypothetical protein
MSAIPSQTSILKLVSQRSADAGDGLLAGDERRATSVNFGDTLLHFGEPSFFKFTARVKIGGLSKVASGGLINRDVFDAG